MVPTVLVISLLVLILYVYNNHDREFEATASAIREVWSGNCHLTCRQSEYSCSNPLSTHGKGQDQVADSSLHLNNQDQSNACQNNCICETCPCELIENVLRRFRPATNLYTQSIELLSNYYYDVLNALLGSADNFSFINQTAIRAEIITKGSGLGSERIESHLNQIKDVEIDHRITAGANEKKCVAFDQKKEGDFNQTEKKSQGQIIKKSSIKELNIEQTNKSELGKGKEVALRIESNANIIIAPGITPVAQKSAVDINQIESIKHDSDSESSAEMERKSCFRCIEKRKICLVSCPSAKGEDNKKSKS